MQRGLGVDRGQLVTKRHAPITRQLPFTAVRWWFGVGESAARHVSNGMDFELDYEHNDLYIVPTTNYIKLLLNYY